MTEKRSAFIFRVTLSNQTSVSLSLSLSLPFNKTNRRTNFSKFIFVKKLHVSGGFSAHHQEFCTVHSALVYVMQV